MDSQDEIDKFIKEIERYMRHMIGVRRRLNTLTPGNVAHHRNRERSNIKYYTERLKGHLEKIKGDKADVLIE